MKLTLRWRTPLVVQNLRWRWQEWRQRERQIHLLDWIEETFVND